jgi:hypothetical protein
MLERIGHRGRRFSYLLVPGKVHFHVGMLPGGEEAKVKYLLWRKE